jgi:hypothetical protein
MNKNIEEENQISPITETPFASASLIGEYYFPFYYKSGVLEHSQRGFD